MVEPFRQHLPRCPVDLPLLVAEGFPQRMGSDMGFDVKSPAPILDVVHDRVCREWRVFPLSTLEQEMVRNFVVIIKVLLKCIENFRVDNDNIVLASFLFFDLNPRSNFAVKDIAYFQSK